jgi:hypothetical protein
VVETQRKSVAETRTAAARSGARKARLEASGEGIFEKKEKRLQVQKKKKKRLHR